MGHAGRAVCIFTPMALTIASFVCVLLINLGGLSKSSSTLNSLYFFQADFKNFSTDSSTLGTAIDLARNEGFIADFYRIGLWNYWSGNESSTSSVQTVTYLSPRKTGFWFDPYQVWNLEKAVNASENVATSLAGTKVDSNVVSQLKSYVTGNADALYEKVLDSGTRKSIQLYAKVSKWMFAAYFAGMWALLLTILFGLLAIFSRFGSFLTWICAIISTILIFAASVTATAMFSVVVSTLHEKLKDYNIKVSVSTHMLAVTWLATAFVLVSTLFWLFTCCCCASSSSNPRNKNNKASTAELGGAGAGFLSRGRINTGEKTGQGYERVASPYAQAHNGASSVSMPMTPVGNGPKGGAADSYYKQDTGYAAGRYEPMRHGDK